MSEFLYQAKEKDNEEVIHFYLINASGVANGIESSKYAKIYNDTATALCENIKVKKGAIPSRKSGFIFEYLDAEDRTINALKHNKPDIYKVVGGTDPQTDVQHLLPDGSREYMQHKLGYDTYSNKYKILDEKYAGRTLVLDKGNPNLKDPGFQQRAKDLNIKLLESDVTKNEAMFYTELREFEYNLSGNEYAPITFQLRKTYKYTELAHETGVKGMKGAAAFAAGYQMGVLFYDLLEGDMDIREMAIEVAKHTLTSGASGYGSGFASSAISSTLSNTAVFSKAVPLIISTKLGKALLTVGKVTVGMPTTLLPTFLIGLTIGTGITTCKIINNYLNYCKKIERYESKIIALTNEALCNIAVAREDLERIMDAPYKEWINNFDEGFIQIFDSIEDVDSITAGLNTILKSYSEKVPFSSRQEFRSFLNDTNRVLDF